MVVDFPLVSIVLLNWNGLEDTKLCLESIHQLDYPNYEIIVVDNGSRQEDKDYLSHLEDIVFIDNATNRGFAGGQVDGYRQAKGDFILLLNNDAVIKSDYLRKALPLFADSQVAVVGGRSYFWSDETPLFDESNPFYSYMNVSLPSAETTPLLEDMGEPQLVNNVSGSAVMVRRSAIERVGYLYEPFFAYYEETDLFARMKRAGYKVVYSPELRIWHRNGASSGAQGGSSFFFYHIFRNRFIFVIRNFESRYLLRFLANYYKAGLKSILQIPRGPVQRRLGLAYGKAMVVTLCKSIPLAWNRHELTKQLGKSNYCAQILDEQVSLSVIVDATASNASEVRAIIDKVQKDSNPLHEYVIVIRRVIKGGFPPQDQRVRLVVDRGYFQTHSINLGCIVARMPWLLVGDTPVISQVGDYHKNIAAVQNVPYTALTLDKTATSLAISKDYYQKQGGFQQDATLLKPNFVHALQYAMVDETLANRPAWAAAPTPDEISTIKKQIDYDSALLKSRHGSRWLRILEKHYRFQQLWNLVRWVGNFSIPLRLKLARCKNMVIYGLTLNKRSLATELRHIKNEIELHGKNRYGSVKLKLMHHDAEAAATHDLPQKLFDLPVFLICFERVESLKTLVKWLEKVGLKKIVFIDNGSTYSPLLSYYANSPYQVLSLYRNIGHTAPWTLDIIRILLPDKYYLVSDPDVIPTEECPSDLIAYLATLHRDFPAYRKVGLGLKIDDLPDYYPLKEAVIAWEKQFWQTEVAENVYEAGVDTTFALYKPFTYNYQLHPSLRTGEPYTARHLPWYVDPSQPAPEDLYYRKRANSNVTSWSMDELPERYKKEMDSDQP